MRIGLLAPPWLPVPPTRYGGTETVVDALARGLVARGHDVVLYATGDSTCPVPRRWLYQHSQRDRLGQAEVELRHVVEGYSAFADRDIVHDHSIAGPAWAAQNTAMPVVTTLHGGFDSGLEEIARRIPLIAISHRQAELSCVPVRAVIHHGIEVERFAVGSGAGDYVCYIGRMAPYKGAREAALIARQVGARLMIAAKMDTAEEHLYFQERVEPLLGDDIVHVGEVDADERLDLLSNAAAMLNPITWEEPFGLVMVEAMACGTPVLAFRRGAAPEIVEDGISGLLCHDVDEAVRRFGELAALDRSACRDRVEKHFSAARMVDEHVRLYERLLAEGQPPSMTG